MTATEQVLTRAERFELAFRDMWILIADNHLPPPVQLSFTNSGDHCSVVAHLPDRAALERWADASAAEPVPAYDGYLTVACTVVGHGGTRLRLTAVAKKL